MSWRDWECLACGHTCRSFAESLNHCDTYEPIDDLDNPTIIPSDD